MTKGRLEAFSDGVLAIIITIMVLELHAPTGHTWSGLRPLLPVFGSYVLSFLYLAIYWNNHHHLLQAARHVDGRVLWANLHLLFWLSLFPFCTAWMGDSHFATVPVAAYGVVLLLAACAYYLLVRALITRHGRESALAAAIGDDRKGRASVAVYAVAIPASVITPWLSCALYLAVSLLWLVPDQRIERALAARAEER